MKDKVFIIWSGGNEIANRVKFIAPVTIYPGEDELLALVQGALRVMNGEEEAKVY